MKKIFLLITVLTTACSVAIAQTKTAARKPAAKPALSPLAASIANGKKVYVKYCLSCHQADGGGVMNMNPPLTHTAYVLGDKNRIIKLVLNGFSEGVEINGNTYTNAMPSFNYLKDKEVADVLTYVRSHFTNKATAVTAADVAPVRALKGK